jgi:Holliday junction resolvasome RuvABC endonuclease subunit
MVLRLTGLSSNGLRLDETDAIALALAALHQTTHPLAHLVRR